MKERCFSCGGCFAAAEGSTHAYMTSSAGCWAAYGDVLAREYSDAALFASSHRLTVDAYALQHPGDPDDRRAIQSFWIHGASLWLVMKMGWSHKSATGALKEMAKGDFPSRPPSPESFAFSHADLLDQPLQAHPDCAARWAEASLLGWKDAHGDFEKLARSIG